MTGIDVIKWMAANDVWPEKIRVHSGNPKGRAIMEALLDKHHRRGHR